MDSKFIRVKDFIFNKDHIICVCKEEDYEYHEIVFLLKDDETRYVKYESMVERDEAFIHIQTLLEAED